MRRSVWDKPRVIDCAKNFPQHIALPRGCLDAALGLLRDHGMAWDLRDERWQGAGVDRTHRASRRHPRGVAGQGAGVVGLARADVEATTRGGDRRT